MKKKLVSLTAILALLAVLWVPVLAAEPQLDYVTDAALLLTDEEWLELEERAEEISQQYQCGVYIVTLDDFTYYVDTNSVYEAAKAIYRGYDLGLGEEQSGVLLLLSMAERDYALISYGWGNTAFTDYGKDRLSEVFLDNFGDDDWYGGFSDYLEKCASMMRSAEEGTPLDVGTSPLIWLVGMLISVGLGCLAALLICGLLESQMKSVGQRQEANTYLQTDSIDITVREDHFINITQTRVKIEKDGGSGGGSGGTTVDRDGFSGKSGKF